ncbi:threonine ammonia-lyase IlvA [Aeromicrobium sp. UC242_57]|uniref:threonine ammonia-lyase IlvA n=1 Tax=Aeromicrobium sp. UC242_57 TaxID=3374624 RepID=UPI00379810A5
MRRRPARRLRHAGAAKFKVPREWYVVPELPRNAGGKILKREIRDEHVAAGRGLTLHRHPPRGPPFERHPRAVERAAIPWSAMPTSPAPTSPTPVSAAAIDAAADRVAQIANRTTLEFNSRLSRATGAQVWLKREDLQPVRSYKIRGAYNFIVQLDDDARDRGVVCASAGNHAQGVALACDRLGTHGRIYVPGTTPRQKRDRIATLGGTNVEVIVVGDSYEDAFRAARDDAERTGAVLVPAFDDPRTICGQGTIAPEIVEQLGGAPDLLVLPVGGGGLVAGISAWMRERCPETRIVGAEPTGAPSMTAALAAGQPTSLAEVDPFVDGAAVGIVGQHTFEQVHQAGVEMMTVDEGHICTEMLSLYQSDGVIAEPAGALASAALTAGLDITPGSTVVCVVSGGNNDISRYGEILERSLIHQGLKHYFLVSFPQEPGALRRFLDEILGPDDDITLFDYVKRNNRETGPALIGVGGPGRRPRGSAGPARGQPPGCRARRTGQHAVPLPRVAAAPGEELLGREHRLAVLDGLAGLARLRADLGDHQRLALGLGHVLDRDQAARRGQGIHLLARQDPARRRARLAGEAHPRPRHEHLVDRMRRAREHVEQARRLDAQQHTHLVEAIDQGRRHTGRA